MTSTNLLFTLEQTKASSLFLCKTPEDLLRPPPCSHHNEVSLFQIAPVKLYILLKHGTDTIILRPTCTSGVRTTPSPTYPHSKTGPRDSRQMIYTNNTRPLVTPPAVTSQSEACLSTDLMAAKDKLMYCDETLSDILLWSINILTHCAKCVCVCVCACVCGSIRDVM